MENQEAVAALSALAQEHRLQVFRLLVRAGAEGVPAGRIAGALKLAGPTLSFHLAQLRHAGLIEVRRAGRSLIYAANYDGMNDLMEFLTANCCTGAANHYRVPVCDPRSGTIVRRRASKGVSRQ